MMRLHTHNGCQGRQGKDTAFPQKRNGNMRRGEGRAAVTIGETIKTMPVDMPMQRIGVQKANSATGQYMSVMIDISILHQ